MFRYHIPELLFISLKTIKPIYRRRETTKYFFSDNVNKNNTDDHKIKVSQQQHQSSLTQQQQQQKQYQIIQRKYQQVNVPGKQSRNYTGLSNLQRQVIEKNSFDLSNPEIKPKVSGINQFQGINQTLMQIDLGKIKIKGQNQVYLSQINPQEIPEDLDILFDKEKTMKVVGKSSQSDKQDNQQASESIHDSQQQKVMKIQKQTFQNKDIKEAYQEQLGIAPSDVVYSRRQKARKMMSTLLILFVLYPFLDTLREVRDCLSMTSEIEAQKMLEIKKIKENNFRRVLLINSGIINNDQIP